MAFNFKMGRSTIASIVRETCIVLWDALLPTEMPEPTEEKWVAIADQFFKNANFPNCIGAVDGKHIRIKCPANSGSLYFNYKKYYSVILMAVADVNYSFIMVDIGSYGRLGDSGVFKESAMGKRLYREQLNLPPERPLPGTSEPRLPFVLVGDEAFALHTNLLRPFPSRQLNVERRIFNYRLSRARRVVECAFGILSNKWRVLLVGMLVDPDFAVDITKATCVLHNFVRRRDGVNFEDTLSCELRGLVARGTGNPSAGINSRQGYSSYFRTDVGSVPWQQHYM